MSHGGLISRSWLSASERCLLLGRRLLVGEGAQDMVEYALLAGFVAVAAGATLPGIAESLEVIFNRMGSLLLKAAGLTKCCD